MSDSQPQAGAAGGQQPQQLLRADDILKLQSLPDDEKQKYRLIMQNFWNMIQQHPQGSPEHTTARQKLSEWSQKFIARERQHRGKIKAQQQQQGSQGSSSQAAPAAQPAQNPPQSSRKPRRLPLAPKKVTLRPSSLQGSHPRIQAKHDRRARLIRPLSSTSMNSLYSCRLTHLLRGRPNTK